MVRDVDLLLEGVKYCLCCTSKVAYATSAVDAIIVLWMVVPDRVMAFSLDYKPVSLCVYVVGKLVKKLVPNSTLLWRRVVHTPRSR